MTFFRPIQVALALLVTACGGESSTDLFHDTPDGSELGSVEQAWGAAYLSGSGNKQVLGTETYLSSDGAPCGTQQLGGSACSYVRSDPAYNLAFGNTYQIRIKPSDWSGHTHLADLTSALEAVTYEMHAASRIAGPDTELVNFLGATSDSDAEILIVRNDAMPDVSTTQISATGKVVFHNVGAPLTESPDLPGDWLVGTQCRIHLNSDNISKAIDATEAADGQGVTFPYWLYKQALGHLINQCIGLGRIGTHQIVFWDTPYTHRFFTRNVYRGTRYFTDTERCLLHYSCAKNSACGGNGWMGHTAISGASACDF